MFMVCVGLCVFLANLSLILVEITLHPQELKDGS